MLQVWDGQRRVAVRRHVRAVFRIDGQLDVVVEPFGLHRALRLETRRRIERNGNAVLPECNRLALLHRLPVGQHAVDRVVPEELEHADLLHAPESGLLQRVRARGGLGHALRRHDRQFPVLRHRIAQPHDRPAQKRFSLKRPRNLRELVHPVGKEQYAFHEPIRLRVRAIVDQGRSTTRRAHDRNRKRNA